MIKQIVFLFMAFIAFTANSQNKIGLSEVVNSTLRNNYNVKIAKNTSKIVMNGATRGNAGALPSLSTGGGVSGTLTNTELIFAGNAQPPIEVSGAQSLNVNGNLTANYVLFNGFVASNTFERLKLQGELSETQAQIQIEAIILQSIKAYFTALQFQTSLNAAQKSLNISVERYERAKLRVEYGSANTIALLNAQVDMKNDSITVMNINLLLENAKSSLAYLMGIDATQIELVEEFEKANKISLEMALENARNQNLEILVARQNLLINEKNIDVAKGSYFPTLSVSSGYSYNSNQSDANFISENRSNGLNGGISLSYSLFNGGRNAISRENAHITWESSKLRIEDLERNVATQVNNAYTTYVNSIKVLDLRKSALEVSKQNFTRSEELFKNGQITGTDFREAQLNLLNAEIQLYLGQINAKLSEYEILRLTGSLVTQIQE